MPRDFTFNVFRQLLTTLKDQQYTFQTFAQFLKNPLPRAIVLRHDVDAKKQNSLHAAQMEAELEISGTFNFRIVPQSFDTEIIRKISALGHEIGYHYEDLALAARDIRGRGTRDEGQGRMGKGRGTRDEGQGRMGKGRGTRDKSQGRKGKGNGTLEEMLYEEAIQSFERNLAKLRQVAPVETICMHGSPLSKYDNRKMWEKYNYRDYRIIGEPYFDLDFSTMLYLTDTGRRWDGEKVSVRDKVVDGRFKKEDLRRDGGLGTRDEEELERDRGQVTGDKEEGRVIRFHSTFDIIKEAARGSLPNQIMINVHPQRWDDRALPWVRELVMQNLKNVVKRLITK